MGWNDWLKLDGDQRMSVLDQITPEQRLSFWLQKFEDVSKLDWDEASLAHIQKLSEVIKANEKWFLAETEDEQKEATVNEHTFMCEWMTFALKDLNWSDKLIHALVGDFGKVLDKEGNLDVVISRGFCQ